MAWAIGFFLGIQKEARRRGGETPCDERSNPIIAPSSVWPSASHLPPRGKAYKEQAAKHPCQNLNLHRRSVPKHLPDTLLRLAPGEHDLPAASLAAELEVHTHPEDVYKRQIQPLDEDTAELKRVYVLPEFRRRGLARQVVEQLELK